MFTVSYWDTGAAVKEFLLGAPFDISQSRGMALHLKPLLSHDNKPFGLDFNMVQKCLLWE